MTFKDKYELLSFIKIYNDTIVEAVDHGGDSGGPYFCNKDGLKESIAAVITKIEVNNTELVKNYPLGVIYDITGNIPQLGVLVK